MHENKLVQKLVSVVAYTTVPSGIFWHRDDYSSVERNTGTVMSENQC